MSHKWLKKEIYILLCRYTLCIYVCTHCIYMYIHIVYICVYTYVLHIHQHYASVELRNCRLKKLMLNVWVNVWNLDIWVNESIHAQINWLMKLSLGWRLIFLNGGERLWTLVRIYSPQIISTDTCIFTISVHVPFIEIHIGQNTKIRKQKCYEENQMRYMCTCSTKKWEDVMKGKTLR